MFPKLEPEKRMCWDIKYFSSTVRSFIQKKKKKKKRKVRGKKKIKACLNDLGCLPKSCRKRKIPSANWKESDAIERDTISTFPHLVVSYSMRVLQNALVAADRTLVIFRCLFSYSFTQLSKQKLFSSLLLKTSLLQPVRENAFQHCN